MRVNTAKRVLSTNVSSALEFLADENNTPHYLTTAWFIKVIAKWFKLMTSRYCSVALGKLHIEEFNESISFLHECIDLFTNLTVDNEGHFKPVQKGMIITTTSILELTNYLLEKRAFQFVFIGRMIQDCVENLFSVIRSKNPVPNALQFKNNLKLISVSLYVRPVSRSNYKENDRDYVTGFLDVLDSKKKTKISDPKININAIKINLEEIPIFKEIDMNILYNIAGYTYNSQFAKNF
ncbi:unnamed protein product [Lasius platythorax]|uniref:Uncharacterized protein n=1 Tax=Lasius platythorax TaxID=488582 RepID=A0AAV2NCD3_9HYME